ncbi:MAG: DEAD/DEAH box helicase [Candidatus Thorarchaeota archaeon]|jgi:ATP-dependent Lhr-like helicase
MSAFSYLSRNIVDFLVTQGIKSATPIQEKAIPAIMSEKQNTLLLSPTGSGKTEAALLPLLDKLQKLKSQRELFGFYILYITPLRALNRDVFKRIEDLCEHLGLTVAVRHGDTTQYQRRKQALKPPNLLITTPETLQAILPGKRLRYHLKTVFAAVVDEIHELADSKRGTQLSLGLERLEHLVDSPIQRVGLSATVGNTGEVAKFLGGSTRTVKTIWAGYDSRKMSLRVEAPTPGPQHKKLARKLVYPPHSAARLDRIVNLVGTHESTIIFTNTRSFAETLGAKMMASKPPYEFDVHHGSLSKDVRISAEERLKNGVSKAIIATSSLELGIDIGQADLVIQYSSPREVSRALQRTGRAGHGIGRTAEGVILATTNLDDITESGVILRRALVNKVERAEIPLMPWDVLCHQICGLLLDTQEIEHSDLLSVLSLAFPYHGLRSESLDRILEFMTEKKLASVENGKITRNKRTRVFYYEHLSTIPDVHKVNALDMATRSSIGVLDEDYVTQNVDTGSVFVIRGRPWQVVSIEEDEVLCAPVTDIDTEAPRWIGEMIPVPYEVATEVAKVWNAIAEKDENEGQDWLKREYGVGDEAQNHVIEKVKESLAELGRLPLESLFIIEDFHSGLVLHAPLGTRTNETLGLVIAALLTTRMGVNVAVERDPYRILFTSSVRIEPEHIVDVLKDYNGKQASMILRKTIKTTQNFTSRFIHVGRRMGIIRRDAKMREIPIKRLVKAYEGSPVFDEAMREVLDEKLDEKRVVDIFDKGSSGKLEVNIAKTESPSHLARLIVEEKTRFEVIGEISDEEEVLAMMEDRLLAKRFRLVCMAKGDWDSTRTVSTMDDIVKCPVCGSRMIAVLPPTDKDFTKIVAKRVAGKPLTKSEEKKYRAGGLMATLVSDYGKRALLVLAGRGIGATTAARVLKPGLTNRHSILREIAKAEKEYARTRPFWRD